MQKIYPPLAQRLPKFNILKKQNNELWKSDFNPTVICEKYFDVYQYDLSEVSHCI